MSASGIDNRRSNSPRLVDLHSISFYPMSARRTVETLQSALPCLLRPSDRRLSLHHQSLPKNSPFLARGSGKRETRDRVSPSNSSRVPPPQQARRTSVKDLYRRLLNGLAGPSLVMTRVLSLVGQSQSGSKRKRLETGGREPVHLPRHLESSFGP